MASMDRNVLVPRDPITGNLDAYMNQLQYNVNCSFVNPDQLNVNANQYLSILNFNIRSCNTNFDKFDQV